MNKTKLFGFTLGMLTAGMISTAHAEKIAQCTIEADGAISSIVIEKSATKLGAQETFVSGIYTKAGMAYDFAETFDGSGKIGIGKGKLNDDQSATYKIWTFAKTPVEMQDLEAGVTIRCE